MAKKKASPRRSDRRDNRTARKTRKKAVRAGAKGNAQEMAKRVQQAFDEGYREGEMREVEYEMSDDGVGADQIFFHEMIVQEHQEAPRRWGSARSGTTEGDKRDGRAPRLYGSGDPADGTDQTGEHPQHLL
jgi:hypothetical protein